MRHTLGCLLSSKITCSILSPLVNRAVTNLSGMDHSVLRGEVSAVLHDRYVASG